MASLPITLARVQNLPRPFLAALAAGTVVALVTLVAPGGLLDAAVSASGLPALFGAAEPPLGLTARLLIAIFGGALAMLATVGGFALADRFAPTLVRRARAEPLVVEEYAPRRRVLVASEEDSPRRPIFAGTDLGTPPPAERRPAYASEWDEPAPVVDMRAPGEEDWTPVESDEPEAAIFEADPEPLELATEATEADPEPLMLDAPAPLEPETALELEPADEAPDGDDGLLDLEPIAEAMWRAPAPTLHRAIEIPVAPDMDEDHADNPEFSATVWDDAARHEARPIDSIPVFAAPIERSVDYGALSLAELIDRLERGLERRAATATQRPDSGFEPRPAAAPSTPADMDAALRDALGTLRRMTAQNR